MHFYHDRGKSASLLKKEKREKEYNKSMVQEALILGGAGLVGGFVGSQVGGGSLITLPALLFIGLPPVLAIGTNVISGWLINIVAVFEYWKTANIKIRHIIPISAWAFGGSLVGASLVLNIEKELLARIVAILFIGIIILVFVEPREKKDKKIRLTIAKRTIAGGIAFVLGIYGGFFGASVTTLFVFLFTYIMGRSLIHAVADAVTVAAVLHIGAFIVFAQNGNINYVLAIPLAIGAVIGSYIGARTALTFGSKWLRWLLVGVVVILVAKLFWGF